MCNNTVDCLPELYAQCIAANPAVVIIPSVFVLVYFIHQWREMKKKPLLKAEASQKILERAKTYIDLLNVPIENTPLSAVEVKVIGKVWDILSKGTLRSSSSSSDASTHMDVFNSLQDNHESETIAETMALAVWTEVLRPLCLKSSGALIILNLFFSVFCVK